LCGQPFERVAGRVHAHGWPGANGSLEEIILNGETLWLGSESFSPARIEGPWGAEHKLAPGADAVLSLRCSSAPVADTTYILVVNFTNGRILSDGAFHFYHPFPIARARCNPGLHL
jgi:hypothetical protein